MRSPSANKRELIKLLRQASHRHHLWEVFTDFITMAALAVANAVDLAQRDDREAEYMRIVGRYEPAEVALFPRMLGLLTEELEHEPGDVLGEVFGELDLGNADRGQFFTPYHLCRLMAAVTIGGDSMIEDTVKARGYVGVHEPACGAGAMLIAMAIELRARGIEPTRHMLVHAIDGDRRAALMCYLQLSLLGIPAEVIVGNTISLEVRERWFTPVYIIDGWRWRTARAPRAPLGAEQPPPDVPACTTDAPDAAAPAAPQLTLF